MKKRIALVIACLLLVLTATGCSGGGESGSDSMKAIKVGSEVKFGRYDQNNIEVQMSMTQGGWTSPIEWIVVEDSNDMYTLLSKYILWRDAVPNPSYDFSNSNIRSDLNEGFYNTAFSEEEKAAMGYWTISDGSEYDCNVVIPSVDQITTWLPSSTERMATEQDGNEFAYWVRSRRMVEKNGDILDDDTKWGYTYSGIRPVICVDKSYLKNTPEPETIEKQYQTVEVGGLSFPVEWYYSLSDSSTETHKNFKFETPSGQHKGVLTIFETEDPMTNEQFDESVEAMVEVGYRASSAYVSHIDDTVKFDISSGLSAYRNTATISINGVYYDTVLYFINNEKEGKVIAIMLTYHSEASPSEGLYEDLDNTVKNASVI